MLDMAIAGSLQKQQASLQLLSCARVQLLQRFIALNPLAAAALAAHGLSAEDIAEQGLEDLTHAAQCLSVPVHSLLLLQHQLHWGQPLEESPGEPRQARCCFDSQRILLIRCGTSLQVLCLVRVGKVLRALMSNMLSRDKAFLQMSR